MYFQLDAERYRRVLLCLGLTGASALQAWWPNAAIDDVGNRFAEPVTRLIAPALEFLLPRPLEAKTVSHQGLELATIEYELGLPRQIPAVTWVCAPLAQDNQDHDAVLLRGSDDGVGGGVPVVFGKTWLGRAYAIDGQRAQLVPWQDSDVRTGVWVEPSDGGEALQAICFGRGGEASGLLRFIEERSEPLEDTTVYWRPRQDDVASFSSLRLELGILRRVGSEERGEGHWVIEAEKPVGAEGRVFVAATATSNNTSAAITWERAQVSLLSNWDAVFGNEICCVELNSQQDISALTSGGLLVGPVLRQNGLYAWVHRISFADWSGKALQWDPVSSSLTSFNGHLGADSSLFSAGDFRVPRGIAIGRMVNGRLTMNSDLIGVVVPLELRGGQQ